ncbi:S-adenosyl-L-methionine-dependent methyltransferase [Dacryopinax primogenitus]|uniref:S-adenosyl-L-methionine-dependent methyltransferase n=1 Tax=Dacryopinax primogenitus (strain DJM 731) TaxID=1858805 RepID=M5G2W5_DACPD|nr:S-adenosyl-L-methionine-dependent methyltransferase [Dacryopinax primogenitus]EJU04571.1 S-adenosyl-L-methionine-dependent methyltransferase [Dacryopinax primogenitus]
MNFYREAAEVLDELDAKKGSIQGNLNAVTEKNRKRTAALVIETLNIISATPLLKEEKRHVTSPNLALVLVHDLLFARGGVQASDGPIKQALLRHQTRLKAELVRLKIRRGVEGNEGLAEKGDERANQIPRYVRVNANVWTMGEAIAHFEAAGFSLTSLPDAFPEPKQFAIDLHIPDLLLFHPSASLTSSPLLTEGKIILQDKASCFPAYILISPVSADQKSARADVGKVVDATAAPGNKTSALSALMGNQGEITAFERDPKRFKTLQIMLKKARCKNVTPLNKDFLSVDPEDDVFEGVTHILLDPSCSGSGIVNRMDYLLEAGEEEPGVDEARLLKLGSFQLKMIKHAMKIKSANRITYSTCSIHKEEDEYVVRDALASEEAAQAGFVLGPRTKVLPSWSRRGLSEGTGLSEDDANCLIRCTPGEDRTNGFFVACFVKATALEQKQVGKRARDEDETPEEGVTSARPRKKKKKKTKRQKEHQ